MDTTQDAGRDMKVRMRIDLRAAMKERRTADASLIRALVAAIDNAEAPPLQEQLEAGSAEIERLVLTQEQVRGVLVAAVEERESDAAELERVGRDDLGAALRAEVLIAQGYIN